MAVTTTRNKIAVTLVLDNGAGKTVSVSLGSLNKDAFNADKVMGIVEDLTPLLDKTLVGVYKNEASTLTNAA